VHVTKLAVRVPMLLACVLLPLTLTAQNAVQSAPAPSTDSNTPVNSVATPTDTTTGDKVPNRPAYRNTDKQSQDSNHQNPAVEQSSPAPQDKPQENAPAPVQGGSVAPLAPSPQPGPAPVVFPSETPVAPVTNTASPATTTPPPPLAPEPPFIARNAYGPMPPLNAHADVMVDDEYGSAYIPVDSWVYPAMLRLYSMGYVDSMFNGIRPWTRRSVLHMLERCSQQVLDSNNQDAIDIYEAVMHEIAEENSGGVRGSVYGLQSAYTRVMEIAGPTLDNSYHLGNSIVNDYGRPYARGFNNVTGFSSLNEKGRFSFYVRAEYQHAPSSYGYTLAQAQPLAVEDEIQLPQPFAISTIPIGPLAAQNPMRVVEASFSGHVLGHEISFGKNDAWLGPATGGSWAWSNNADNIYGFRIDRVEPLHIPWVSRVTGPFRYEFFVGSLQGHSFPNSPYIHMEKLSFKPTPNVELGFERTVIWGGEGHEPVTIHTFLKSFFSFQDVQEATKYSKSDPGARFSAFDASYRLPYLRNWLTFYVDSEAHDDVNPISAPRRADFRTGLYLSHVPTLPKLDLRVEAADSDQDTSISTSGQATYWEVVQQQGYTNKGQILGDWMGREGKGGQAWLTYHLSGKEQLQLEYRRNKDAKDFFLGGTTQNQIKFNAVMRLYQNIELNGYVQYENWKAPYWMAGQHSDTTTALQITWFPKLRTTR
jgi:hypothetical protein